MSFWMYLFGLLTVVTSIGVIAAKKPLNSALWLVATLFLVAIHFALMRADFIATLQVLIYAGAIMVLVIFVIMLLGSDIEVHDKPGVVKKVSGVFLACLFVYLVALAVGSEIGAPIHEGDIQVAAVSANAGDIGQILYTKYLVPFQFVGILLLAAIIGAAVLAHEPKRPLKPGRGLRAKQHLSEGEG